MNKMVMAIIIAIIIVITASIFIGCDKLENNENTDNVWVSHGRECCTKIIDIDGHTYIIMDAFRGGSIIHAASCNCMKK